MIQEEIIVQLSPAEFAAFAENFGYRLVAAGAPAMPYITARQVANDAPTANLHLHALDESRCLGEISASKIPAGSLVTVWASPAHWPALQGAWNKLVAELERLSCRATERAPTLVRPDGQDREAWFRYKYDCDQAGIKVTLPEVARALNLSHGHVKNIYPAWMAEHQKHVAKGGQK